MRNKVIVIDSGLYIGHDQLSGINIAGKINLTSDNIDDLTDKVGHGTAVTSVIQSINPKTEFVIIRIFENDLRASEEKLIEALTYLIEKNFQASIIHMSLGVSYYSEELFSICKELQSRGNLIISAFDNSGAISYPAAFEFTIGVEASELCTKATDLILPDNEITDVYSKGGLHRVAWINNKYAIRQGNSISAAYVTGILSKHITENMSKDKAMDILYDESTYTNKLSNSFDCKVLTKENSEFFIGRIKKAAIYPYNKETSNLIHFSNILSFEIEGVYSDKYMGNIGQSVEDFETHEKYTIQNINCIDFEKIDTLIIGHLLSLNNVKKTNDKKSILEKCLEHDVNVFTFDSFDIDEYYDKFKVKNLFIEIPSYLKNPGKKRVGKLYKIQTPVIGIFGTSSIQGKFTLQLLLRKKFLDSGYSVGQLSTEPTGMLFGMDEVFPYGFGSCNNLPDYEFINELNRIMHKIDIKNRDIIIVGSQSRSVPEQYNNIGHMAIKSMQFLLGVLPDIIILCININDSLDYIQRTISIFENMTTSKTIALVLYPFTYTNGWNRVSGKAEKISSKEYDDLKEKIWNRFKLNTYLLSDNDEIEKLYNQIIEYFS